MQNHELQQCLIPGRTSFILNTNEKESYITKFRNTTCRLLKGPAQKNWYLIETNQNYRGLDFSQDIVEVNKFFLVIRKPSAFRKNKRQDVIVYLPSDVNNPMKFEISRTKRLSWGHIEKIENHI